MDISGLPAHSYDEKSSPEKNIALALFAIANELRILSFGNAIDIKQGALEGLAMRITDGFSELSDAINEIQLPAQPSFSLDSIRHKIYQDQLKKYNGNIPPDLLEQTNKVFAEILAEYGLLDSTETMKDELNDHLRNI